MSVLSRVSLYSGERFDIPDARAQDAASLNDWRYFISGNLTAKSVVISGFDITNYSSVFAGAGPKLQQNNVAMLHPEAATQASGFYVSSGTESDFSVVLNASTTNYVELDLSTSTGTPDVRAFWDPGAAGGQGAEYTATVDTLVNLELNILVNVSGFTAGRLPLYKFVTNSSGTITSFEDCRNPFYDLATGGTSPNPNNSYSFPADAGMSAYARFPAPSTATPGSVAPFLGGGKYIASQKEWMDVVMTKLKELGATPYWISKSASVASAYQNAAMTLISGGTWRHLGLAAPITNTTSSTITVAVGQMFMASSSTIVANGVTYSYSTFNSTTGLFTGVSPAPAGGLVGQYAAQGAVGHVGLANGSTLVRLGQGSSSLLPFASIDLTTLRALFIFLSTDGSALGYGMGQDATSPVKPQAIASATNSSITVASGGNYIAGGGNVMIRGQLFSYATYAESGGTGLFSSVTPDASGLAQAGDLAFQAASSGTGYYHAATAANLPGTTGGISEGVESCMWLAYFDGADTIFIKDSELIPGESVTTGGSEPDQIFTYIGSSGAADASPVYNVASIPNGTDLTTAISDAYHIIETPIYDEKVAVTSAISSGDIVYLPSNSKTSTAANYSAGTDELEVYENGVLLQKGYDYTENTSNSIQMSRDVYVGSVIRFRVASIGGAGASSGGSSGTSLQTAYNNGNTVAVSTGQPLTITGSSGKLLHVAGDVQIDGVIDPTAIEFTPQSSSPLASGVAGFWVHPTEGLQYQHTDNTVVAISQAVEAISGNAASLSMTMTNGSGATIPAGSPVYISDTSTVKLANAGADVTSRFFGIAAVSIAAGATGQVIYQGVVPGMLTGLGLPAGEYLWLQTSDGGMSPTAPSTAGAYLIILGITNGNDLILQQQTNGIVGV
jgi:hypothetical protein